LRRVGPDLDPHPAELLDLLRQPHPLGQPPDAGGGSGFEVRPGGRRLLDPREPRGEVLARPPAGLDEPPRLSKVLGHLVEPDEAAPDVGVRAGVPRLVRPGSRPACLPASGGLSLLSGFFSLRSWLSASIRAALANSGAGAFSAPASTRRRAISSWPLSRPTRI